MDTETKNLIAIIVSAYAAIISTITLIWNIANSIISKMSRMSVKVSFHDTLIGNQFMEPVKGNRTMRVSVVNKSNKTKYIQVVNLELPYKTKFGKISGLYNIDSKFPKEVKPEEEIKIDYVLNTTASWIFENYQEGDFKIFIVDTTGKKYKSNKVKLKYLKAAYDFNCKLQK